MNKKYILINILFTLVVGFVSHFILLTPWNIQSIPFLMTIAFLLLGNAFIIAAGKEANYVGQNMFKESKVLKVSGIIVGAGVIAVIVANLSYSPIFRANTYANRISYDTKEFSEAIDPVNYDNLPLLDRLSSVKLGDRQMGEIPEYVSQFDVSNSYTQINYKNDLVRVTEIDYAGLIKYFTNREQGTPGYIVVNTTTGEAKLIKTNEGLRYTPGAYFLEDLNRHIHLHYPTKIFGTPIFEIDDSGNPFYIAPTYKYKAFGLLPDVEGAILVNAATGEHNYYDVADVPTWVDNVYNAGLIISQINDKGLYNGGFFNSIIGQKNVTKVTEGYTYLSLDDDIYMYTGITSVQADQSNIGFMLVNLRTKETTYIPMSSASEISAMETAQGEVQDKRYIATFPLLVNLEGKPTYILSLKDANGLIKAYGIVDVTDYQKVKVVDSVKGIKYACNEYLKMLGSKPITSDEVKQATITVDAINNANIDGTTYYYIVDNENNYYMASIKTYNLLPFVKSGDTLNVTYYPNEVNTIIEISK